MWLNKKAQTATILTLIIALIFLFIVITMNIGRVSQKKVIVDNACDSAALFYASSIGSVAQALRQELELWGDAPDRCDTDWFLVIGGALVILAVIGGVILAIVTAGTAAPISGAIIAGALGLVSMGLVGVGLFGYGVVNMVYIEPKMVREMQAKFQNMTAEQRLQEAAIQSALFSVIDDPAYVPDSFDADRDGSFGGSDKIPQFNHWYFRRLNSLPRIGYIIEDFYHYLYVDTGEGIPRFGVIEDPETWLAEEAWFAVVYEAAAWYPMRKYEHEDGARSYLTDSYPHFICAELWEYGYGVPWHCCDKDDPDDTIFKFFHPNPYMLWNPSQLGLFALDLYKLQELAKEIYAAGKEELVATFDTWYADFYNPESTNDWYDILQDWIYEIDDWIETTIERSGQIEACAASCCNLEWGCFDSSVVPEENQSDSLCCDWDTIEVCDTGDCTAACVAGCGDCSIDSTCCNNCHNDCSAKCHEDICVSWDGCFGDELCCCQLCDDEHCPPDPELPASLCTTPTTPGTCNGASSPDEYCCDTACYLSVWEDPNCEAILDQDILNLLAIRGALENFCTKLEALYNEAQLAKSSPWSNKAIYVWKDQVMDDEETLSDVTPEEAVHMVYVEVNPETDGLGGGFKFPYVDQERRDLGLTICKLVNAATGNVHVKVVRYDEDLAKQGPLSDFWRFRFRRHPGTVEQNLSYLRSVADRFYNLLNDGGDCTLDDLISAADAEALGAFAWTYGVGAMVTASYGPGFTYRPEELPGEAPLRNRDIVIHTRYR